MWQELCVIVNSLIVIVPMALYRTRSWPDVWSILTIQYSRPFSQWTFWLVKYRCNLQYIITITNTCVPLGLPLTEPRYDAHLNGTKLSVVFYTHDFLALTNQNFYSHKAPESCDKIYFFGAWYMLYCVREGLSSHCGHCWLQLFFFHLFIFALNCISCLYNTLQWHLSPKIYVCMPTGTRISWKTSLKISSMIGITKKYNR